MSEKENQEQDTQVAIIDDLPVSLAELDEVKGGPIVGVEYLFITAHSTSPTTTINHNETVASDEADEDQNSMPLADLEPVDEAKGGIGVDSGSSLTIGGCTSMAATQGRGLFTLSTAANGPKII